MEHAKTIGYWSCSDMDGGKLHYYYGSSGMYIHTYVCEWECLMPV